MYLAAKHTIKRCFQILGLEVRSLNHRSRHSLAALLKLYEVDTIFDIGANIGTSGEYFRMLGFNQKIVSFEPVSHLYQQLQQKAKHDPLWLCENIALGDTTGEATINVLGDKGAASSLLPIAENIRLNVPNVDGINKEIITASTLDSIVDSFYPQGDRLFLKIDVQGYERNVLEGAKETLSRVVGLKIEMSLVTNYEGELLFHEILPYLYSRGFRLCSIDGGWANQLTHELYQVDGILFRPDRLELIPK